MLFLSVPWLSEYAGPTNRSRLIAASRDNLNHEWMMKFVQHRVADPRILRLIQKWLKAGISEEGQRLETKVALRRAQWPLPLHKR